MNLNEKDLDDATGGMTSIAALNPQPIPPGRMESYFLRSSLSLTLPPNPGCPGPRLLPPSPC